jgi:hypothetical protein
MPAMAGVVPAAAAGQYEQGYERDVRVEFDGNNRGDDTVRTERHGSQLSITLKRIDTAIMLHLRNHVRPVIVSNGQQIIVPIEYANAERWKQARKDGYIRDKNGKLQVPIILFRRTSIKRNALTNPVNKYVDRTFVTGWNRYNTYDKFAVLNRIVPSRELVSVKMPDYVDLAYDFLVWTDYVEQMNDVLEMVNFEMDEYWGDRENFKFRVKVEDYTTETDIPSEGDRVIRTTFQMKVSAYLLPETMMHLDKGIQATDQLRYSRKKVVIFQEVEGSTFRGGSTVREEWPNAGSGSGLV